MSESKNSNLSQAKRAKNDEFYTQYHDIEKEMQAYLDYNPDVFRNKTILLPCDDPDWSNFTKYFAQNFERFGIKKLISTSYAPASKGLGVSIQPSLLEISDERYDKDKHETKGKIFTITRDINNDSRIDINDLEWNYLEGDGDFRSDEITRIAQDCDLVITNPPFSAFREFLAWIVELDKSFAIIGNKNAVTYKELFPLIKSNKVWSGRTEWSGGMWFETINPDSVDKVVDGINMKNVSSIWFTNIDHGRRHEPLQLMRMEDNLRYNKKVIKNKETKNTIYQKYDKYDAIEVSYTDAIPSDYNGAMGVPISFLDKYNPEQFELLDANDFIIENRVNKKPHGLIKDKDGAIDGKPTYVRILIRHKTNH